MLWNDKPTTNFEIGGPDGFDAGAMDTKIHNIHARRTRNRIADRTFAQQRSRREDSSASSLTAALTSTSTFDPSTLSVCEKKTLSACAWHVSDSTTNSTVYFDRTNNSTSRLRVGPSLQRNRGMGFFSGEGIAV